MTAENKTQTRIAYSPLIWVYALWPCKRTIDINRLNHIQTAESGSKLFDNQTFSLTLSDIEEL